MSDQDTPAIPFDPEDPATNKAYTTAEVATMFSVTSETIRDWIVSGKLPAVRLPTGHFRILRADVMAFASDRYQKQPAAAGGGDVDLI